MVTDLNIFIQIIGVLALIGILYFFYKYPPFEQDSITVLQNKLIIIKKNKSKTYLISQIESVKSTSELVITMKDKEKVIINYGEWNIGLVKVKALQKAIQQSIENAQSNME